MTENVKLGLGLDLAMNGTMTVNFSQAVPPLSTRSSDADNCCSGRFMRLGQKITVPVIVASSFNATLATGFTVLPALAVVAANHFVVHPRKRKRISSCVFPCGLPLLPLLNNELT